jgi:DNA (cytosine-5)-methyltransferase 1
MKQNMDAIDLFCGCGGISLGLQMAGFTIRAGIDIEENYIRTFTHNFATAKSYCEDLRVLTPQKLLSDLGLKKGELKLLAGGPPCQGFSKNVPRAKRSADSENNQLIYTYLKYCEEIYPEYVLIENVAEMRNGFDSQYTATIENYLIMLGYSVFHDVHNAADYGVPQKRRRAFFIARRDGGKIKAPAQTHFEKSNGFDFGNSYINVWDAISDLPSLEQGQEATAYDKKPSNDYQKRLRNESGVLYNHKARKLQPTQDQRLRSLEPGQGIKDLPDYLRPKGGYSGAYGILTKDMVCPTITRWVFHPGSGRWGHPVDKRIITIREAARLHSYPDSFEFIGSYNDQAGQIGNSVPPLLAKTMADSLLR